MARYEFVKGLPVITMVEGKHIGKVGDLVVDPERKAVSWLRLHTGGLLGGERLWISVTTVHAVGEDAVTIDSETDARTPADAPQAVALVKAKRAVIGAKAITESGEHLGEVRDYEFDPDTFALISLTIHPGMDAASDILIIASDRVLTIGEDVIVVAADTVTRPREMAGVSK